MFVFSLRVQKLSGFAKIWGLIGKKKPYSVFFRTRFGIHTFGLSFPIDVLVLDNENKVVKLKKDLRPNNMFFWNPIFDKILELPSGIVLKKKIQIGEVIICR